MHKITIKYLLLKISHKYEIIILKYTFTSIGKSDKKVKIKNKLIILILNKKLFLTYNIKLFYPTYLVLITNLIIYFYFYLL